MIAVGDQIIPINVAEGLARYIFDQCPTGGFLKAVLSNDLKEAYARADAGSERSMGAIVRVLYNHTPLACQGSPEIVQAWLAAKVDDDAKEAIRAHYSAAWAAVRGL